MKDEGSPRQQIRSPPAQFSGTGSCQNELEIFFDERVVDDIKQFGNPLNFIYDNTFLFLEIGHYHLDDEEFPYKFSNIDQLIVDFRSLVKIHFGVTI